MQVWSLEHKLHKSTNMFRDIELIGRGHAVTGGDLENLVLTAVVEGCPFDFCTITNITSKIKSFFSALMGDS